MRTAILARTSVCALALVALAVPASAARITQISWEFGGPFSTFSNFSGPNLSGPVLGGSFVLTPVAGTVVTPTTRGDFFFRLSATGGGLEMPKVTGLYVAGAVNAYVTPASVDNIACGLGTCFTLMTFLSGGVPATTFASASLTFALSLFGAVVFTATLGQIYHRIDVGNEVRTYVPEPTSAGLLGLALLLGPSLAWAMAHGRRHRSPLHRGLQ